MRFRAISGNLNLINDIQLLRNYSCSHPRATINCPSLQMVVYWISMSLHSSPPSTAS